MSVDVQGALLAIADTMNAIRFHRDQKVQKARAEAAARAPKERQKVGATRKPGKPDRAPRQKKQKVGKALTRKK